MAGPFQDSPEWDACCDFDNTIIGKHARRETDKFALLGKGRELFFFPVFESDLKDDGRKRILPHSL